MADCFLIDASDNMQSFFLEKNFSSARAEAISSICDRQGGNY